jgi:mono/diheme cytochrome c family protein
MNKSLLLFWLAVSAAMASPARADDHGPRPDLPAPYRQECGSCHVPFPPRGLPATSWQRLMADLPHHFGSDASLDPDTTRQLAEWLQAHAGRTARAGDPPQDRLTRSAWFVREHDEVPTSLWRSAAVRSPSNCAACHTRAAEGRFGEREIRLPR